MNSASPPSSPENTLPRTSEGRANILCRSCPWATLGKARFDLLRDACSQHPGEPPMKMSSAIRVALLALTAFAGATLSSACHADEGSVSLTIYKAEWIIGGSGGGGVLNFRGRRYGLSTGGLDYGLVFGGSKTVLHGRVSNIYRPSDVAGVYGAAGGGPRGGGGGRPGGAR